MGLFGGALPEGYEIREVVRDGRIEYTIYYKGKATLYTTFNKELAKRECKFRARNRTDK